jgi:hypothetical protein
MLLLNLIRVALFVGVYSVIVPAAFAQHEHSAGDPSKLGKVTFPVSCDTSVQQQFSSAVAMLHSFWYEKAHEAFGAVAEKDPTCGMAYWGIAITYYHPIWQPPGPADLKAGHFRGQGKARWYQNTARAGLYRRHRDVLQGLRQD